jgi:protease PrsW
MFYSAINNAFIVNTILSTALLLLILYLDRYEKEPIGRIALLLLVSIAATTLFGLIKLKIMGDAKVSLFFGAYIEAGFFEELLKFGILWLLVWRWKSFNESVDAIIYLAVIAVGFTYAENMQYFIKYSLPGALQGNTDLYNHQFLSIIGARIVPAHVLIDITAAYFLGKGVIRNKRGPYSLLAFAAAVFLHGTWNILAGKSTWFVAYEFALTITTVLSILSALHESVFRRTHTRIVRLIDNNVYLARSGVPPLNDLYPHRGELATKLDNLKKALLQLNYLEGQEQKRIMSQLEECFKQPLLAQPFEGINGLGAKLESLAQTIKERGGSPDWSYYFGLILLFGGTFIAGTIASAIIERFIH